MMRKLLARRGLRTAIVLDDFLFTLGGGERSCLSYARALAQWGLEVEVWARTKPPPPDVIASVFGQELAAVPCREVPPPDFPRLAAERAPDVFIHHTFGHMDRNPGRIGFYVQMFPPTAPDREEDGAFYRDLASYNRVLCISDFARRHTLDRWGVEPSRLCVLHPPIDAVGRAPAKPRAKTIVNVGRFNPAMHGKNQHVLIEEFARARGEDPALEGWKLVLAGQVNEDADSLGYFESCKRAAAAAGGAVELRPGLNAEDLWQLLGESAGYVHATGAFIPEPEQPERCEHLGLSILEAMSRGCIPLVYGRGGILEILRPDWSGIVFHTPEELRSGLGRLARMHGSWRGRLMRCAGIRAARRVNPDAFRRRLGWLLWRETTKLPRGKAADEHG